MRAYIQSVSMPRSGHHYLIRLLRAYYNDKDAGVREMSYCEYYNCCSTHPCTLFASDENARVPVLIQKSHDEYLRRSDEAYEPPMKVTNRCKHLIQVRHPIPSTISDFKMEQKRLQACYKRENDATLQSGQLNMVEHWLHFAERQLDYRIRFLEKWVLNNPWQDSVYHFLLDYETLIEKPLDTLLEVLHFIKPDEQIDMGRAERALIKRPVKAIRNTMEFEFAATLEPLERRFGETWSECKKKIVS